MLYLYHEKTGFAEAHTCSFFSSVAILRLLLNVFSLSAQCAVNIQRLYGVATEEAYVLWLVEV